MELQNGRFHILAGIRCPLVLSVGTDLLRVSRHWRFNSSAFGLCAHVIHVFRVHWKRRSRINRWLCPSQRFYFRFACVALAGPYDWAAIFDALPELTREAFRVRSHLRTGEEARQHARTLTLKDAAKKIECPLFLVAGKQDRLVPWQDSQRIAAQAKGPVELLVVEDGNHIANNRPYRYRLRSADWMAAQLGLPRV